MHVVPATNAISECSFSVMWRIKPYLHSTMPEGRLNHLMFMNIHKDLLNGLSLKTIANKFVRGNEHQLSQFGRYLSSWCSATIFLWDQLHTYIGSWLETFSCSIACSSSIIPSAVIIFAFVFMICDLIYSNSHLVFVDVCNVGGRRQSGTWTVAARTIEP